MNHRHKVIDQIVAWLDRGWPMWSVHCWPWQICPTPVNPVPVAIHLQCSHTEAWILQGLLPEECDLLRRHLPSRWDGTGTAAEQEMLVVATLVTLFRQRDMRLRERTILHLHGKPILFGQRVLDSPSFGRMWLHEYREQYGWDELVKFVAVQQKHTRFLGTGRRGRGRPKDEGFHDFVRKSHERLKNVAQVAKKAAERFGITEEAAAKRIRRSTWYKQMTPALTIPKRKSTPHHQSPSRGKPSSIEDVIEKHIRLYGASKADEIAAKHGIDTRKVECALMQNPSRFQYQPNGVWGLL